MFNSTYRKCIFSSEKNPIKQDYNNIKYMIYYKDSDTNKYEGLILLNNSVRMSAINNYFKNNIETKECKQKLNKLIDKTELINSYKKSGYIEYYKETKVQKLTREKIKLEDKLKKYKKKNKEYELELKKSNEENCKLIELNKKLRINFIANELNRAILYEENLINTVKESKDELKEIRTNIEILKKSLTLTEKKELEKLHN